MSETNKLPGEEKVENQVKVAKKLKEKYYANDNTTAANNNSTDSNSKKEPSLSEQFTGVLGAFGPQMGGLLADLITGGGSTGNVGLKTGMALGKALQDTTYKQKQQKLAQERLDTTLITETGKTTRHEENKVIREKQLDLKERQFAETLEKNKEVSPQVLDKIASRQNIINKSDKIIELLSKPDIADSTGKIAGNIAIAYSKLTGSKVENLTELHNHLEMLVFDIIKAQSGTAVAEKEREEIRNMVGSVGEKTAKILEKIQAWKERAEDEIYTDMTIHENMRRADFSSMGNLVELKNRSGMRKLLRFMEIAKDTNDPAMKREYIQRMQVLRKELKINYKN